ncbi:ABC transporter permease [Stella sp.]|uniref:ABC transporter permease n=1 Tax=Stella sp. TaxID=2912054 RepID=UPI0035AF01C1
MIGIVVQRLIQSVVTLTVLAVVIFGLSRMSGDPIELMLPVDATAADRSALRATIGLDQPLHEQFLRFVGGAVTGDLGISIRERRPALDLVMERLPNSLTLALVALAMAMAMAFPLAIAAAVWRGSAIDVLARLFAVLGQSFPTFWVGLVLIIIFAGELRILPAGGTGSWLHYILPGFTLGWFVVAGMMRLLRSSMIEVLDSEFVKLARIKGLPEWIVIWKHALRNALVPVVTFGGVYLALLISTAVIVETVFAWPGLGRLAYDAIRFRDFPVTQAVVLVTAIVVVLSSLAVDLLYMAIDPRMRGTQKEGGGR